MSNFAERLRFLRLKMNLSQEKLAEELGMTRSAIGNYETGIREPDFETLEVIADYFNCDMDYLTGRPTDSTIPKYDPIIIEFMSVLDQLTDEQKHNVLDMARFLAHENIAKQNQDTTDTDMQ